MWSLRSTRTVAIALSTLAFAVFCVAPVAYILGVALSSSYNVSFLDSRQLDLLLNTLLLGTGTAAMATVVGAPLGFALARVPLRFTMTARLMLVAPALLPPYVMALAWTYLATTAIAVPGLNRILPDP